MKKFLIALTVVAMLAMTVPAFAQDERLPPDPNLSGDFTKPYMGERIMFDVFILRPLGLAATAIGLGSSLVAAPWAATSNSCDTANKYLVEQPFRYTFTRPVGDIDF